MTDATAAPSGGIWSRAYLPVTLANLTIVAIAAFDGLALVAALPSIAEDLGRVSLLPWVITAYLALSAVAGIAAGPVIDAVGIRRTFRLTGLWFLVASGLAAVAPSMELLIAARALQGIGGGLVISVALSAVGLAYPDRLRPRAFAANSMVWGLLGFGGPAITAGLLALAGWRMIFIAQLPVTALALAAGWRALPSTRDRPAPLVIDGVGIAWLALLVAAMLTATSQVGTRWRLAGAATLAFVVIAWRYWCHAGAARSPVLAREHLSRFPLRRIHLTSGLVLVAGLAADNYLPLYMQTTRGSSETLAAFSVLFLTVGWTVAAFIASRLLDRYAEHELILGGSLLIVPSVVVAGSGIARTWPLVVVFAAFFVMGLSIGFISTSGLTLLQSTSNADEMGRVNSAHQFVRTLCITFGVAIGGAILLFVVDVRTGDVEAVRDVLAGAESVPTAGGTTAGGGAIGAAVRDGLAWVHVFSGLVGVACVVAAATLFRDSRRRTAAASGGDAE